MNNVLLLSGGTGTRLGADLPKQYIRVKGKMIITYCLETLLSCDAVDAIEIVADDDSYGMILEELRSFHIDAGKIKGCAKPGTNRQMSILHGLMGIQKYAAEDSFVMVHDAARPLLTEKQIRDCFGAAAGHDGVMPSLPMKDTVYLSREGNRVTELLDRSRLYAGQAPEVFVLGKYFEANRRLLPDQILWINGSTEPAIMAGMDIVMIPGDEHNFKITTMADLERFQEIVNGGTLE